MWLVSAHTAGMPSESELRTNWEHLNRVNHLVRFYNSKYIKYQNSLLRVTIYWARTSCSNFNLGFLLLEILLWSSQSILYLYLFLFFKSNVSIFTWVHFNHILFSFHTRWILDIMYKTRPVSSGSGRWGRKSWRTCNHLEGMKQIISAKTRVPEQINTLTAEKVQIIFQPLEPWQENCKGIGYKIYWKPLGDEEWGERVSLTNLRKHS